nr:hypothetical protein Itr_chr09CG16960 [Ipomoea trifida]
MILSNTAANGEELVVVSHLLRPVVAIDNSQKFNQELHVRHPEYHRYFSISRKQNQNLVATIWFNPSTMESIGDGETEWRSENIWSTAQ